MSFISRSLQTLLTGIALTATALAGTNPHVTVRPQARVTQKVDAKSVVQLSGTVPGKLAAATDLGRASSGAQLSQLHLVLKSSDEQIAALNTLLDQQQDKSSENFHQWLTPDTFATAFGVHQSDITAVTNWLASSGLSVTKVGGGGRIITFSGSVSAIEKAFHTEMHSYKIDGETHISNATEISIPTALTDVVAGPARLNDIPYKRHGILKQYVRGTDGKIHGVVPGTKNTPDYTDDNYGDHWLVPADFNTVYNTNSLIAAGTNGHGVKIGIVGQTQVDLADTQIFRSIFGLPNNDPIFAPVAGEPLGVIPDDFESDLDLQWAGAVAPQATVIFGPAGTGYYAGGGIDASMLAFIEQNNVDIISMSYGGCESSDGSAVATYWNTMYAQAAAQGQSVFVSAGDSSATGCASSEATTAAGKSTAIYSVNAIGSSAYNVAVGGTMFNEGGYIAGLQEGAVAPYWSANDKQPFGSALEYIPESVMSDGAFNEVYGGQLLQQYYGIFGTGGGVSEFVARPPWQTGAGISATADPAGPTFTLTGAIKTGLHRLVPDVSLMGSVSHDDVIICSEASCTLDPTTGLLNSFSGVGGTSVAAPAWAGVMALIDQANGGRQGNPNYHFYQLAAAETNLAACASVAQPATPVNTACNFNDIVTGNNFSPITANGYYVPPTLDPTGTTITAPGYINGTLGKDYLGFAATTGFDEATGLGSPNIANIVKNWKSVTFTSSATTLTATPTTTTHGTAISFTTTVTSGSGTPTGTVSILASGVNGTSPNVLTLQAGTATASFTNLPGGTYSVVAQYAGDGIYAPSTSAPVTLTINKENTVITTNVYTISTSTGGTASVRNGAYTYGEMVYLFDQTRGASGTTLNGENAPVNGAPTGTLTYTPTYTPTGGTATPLSPLVQTLDKSGIAYMAATAGWPYYDIFQNYPTLNVGAYSIAIAYSGDNSFNANTATTNITVAKATSPAALGIVTPDVASTGTAQVIVEVDPIYDGVDVAGYLVQTGAYPTGTVNILNAANATIGTGTLTAASQGFVTISIPATSLAAGANNVHAAYLGDGNYNASTTGTGKITVLTTAASTVGLSVTPANPVVLTPITLTATIPAGATGAELVTFLDNGTFLEQVATTRGSTTVTSDTFDFLTAGSHNFTATYGGNATAPAGTSAAQAVTIGKNSPGLTLNAVSTSVAGAQVVLQSNFITNPTFTEPYGAPVVPTGAITFLDNGVSVGTAPLVFAYGSVPSDGIGIYTASLTITPGPGNHSYTASYPGDSNYNPVTPTLPVATTTAAPNVSLALVPSSLTIPRGQAGLSTLVVTGTAYWAGTVNVSCATTLKYATCALGAPSVTLTGQTSFVETKTIAISVITAPLTPAGSGSIMWIPAVFFAGFLFLRRKNLSLRGRQLLTLAVMVCGVTALSGCGASVQHNGIQAGTPLGASSVTLTITAVGSNGTSPNSTQTVTLPVTVVSQ